MKREIGLRRRSGQAGFSLLEVLIAVLILAIGLLGLAGLQTRANLVEMEAYQRSVALQLVQDMASRVAASREYLTEIRTETNGQVFGANTTLADGYCDPPFAAGESARQQVCGWHAALSGIAQTLGAGGEAVAAPIGMRGCVIEDTQSLNALAEFVVVGVWQGLSATASPAAGTPGATCDAATNFGTGMRRAVVTRVLIPRLAGE